VAVTLPPLTVVVPERRPAIRQSVIDHDGL
jgi:hypothetical protein